MSNAINTPHPCGTPELVRGGTARAMGDITRQWMGFVSHPRAQFIASIEFVGTQGPVKRRTKTKLRLMPSCHGILNR